MPQNRQLAAIMFTDIAGYTALMEENEHKAFELLKKNRDVQKPLIVRFKGRWLKEIGDGVLASFATVTDAIYAAAAIQKACESEEDLKLRIGIHLGEVVFEGDDVFGSGVNIASRLEPMAPVGGILVSETVHRNVANQPGIHTSLVAEKELKGVKEPMKVYQLAVDDIESRMQAYVSAAQTISKDQTPFSKPRLVFSVVAISLLLLLGYLYFQSQAKHSGQESVSLEFADKSIAVLPFDNESTDPENQYFVNGMMEDIRNNLSKIADLKVISKTSTEKYRGTTKRTGEISEELEVAFLLEGTVQKQGNQVKIHAQLIHGESDNHVWADTYVRDISDVFKVQSEIAQVIAGELFSTITPAEKELIQAEETSNLTAYDFFLRGRNEHMKRWQKLAGIEAVDLAMKYYKQAVALDPGYARAYAGMALAYFEKEMLGSNYFEEDYLDSVLILADRALALDPRIDEGYFVRGQYYNAKADFERALKELDLAIAVNPNFSWAYWLKSYITGADNPVEGIKNLTKAARIEKGPLLDDIYRTLGNYYLEAGFPNIALEYYRKKLVITGDTLDYQYSLSGIEHRNGNLAPRLAILERRYQADTVDFQVLLDLIHEEMFASNYSSMFRYALSMVRLMEERDDFGRRINVLHRVGFAYWMNGKEDQARRLFQKELQYSEKIERGYFRYKGAPYNAACMYAMLGENEQAFRNLQMVLDKEFFPAWWVFYFRNDPMLDNLRADPRFQKILKEVEQKHQHGHDQVQAWLDQPVDSS